jgi:thiosulfate dehydrogenase [quinone] large subunit
VHRAHRELGAESASEEEETAMTSLTAQRDRCGAAGTWKPAMDGRGRASAAPGEHDRAAAYAILRLTLGMSTLLHGVTRLTADVGAFAATAVQRFAGTRLPADLVCAFATALPFLESALGFLIMIGLWTRAGLAGGAMLTCALVVGFSFLGDGTAPGVRMVYAVAYFVLLTCRTHDRYSVDRLFRY